MQHPAEHALKENPPDTRASHVGKYFYTSVISPPPPQLGSSSSTSTRTVDRSCLHAISRLRLHHLITPMLSLKRTIRVMDGGDDSPITAPCFSHQSRPPQPQCCFDLFVKVTSPSTKVKTWLLTWLAVSLFKRCTISLFVCAVAAP